MSEEASKATFIERHSLPIPSLEPWPTETSFFDKLADDVYDGNFEFKDGALTVYDEPGFGGTIDEAKLKRYRV